MKRFKTDICEADKKICSYFDEIIRFIEIELEFASRDYEQGWIEDLKKAHEIRQLFIDTHLMTEEMGNE